jgi:pilus assembly protein CpaB
MRRWLAIGSALALAVIGAFLLITYVQGAEDRALEGQELVSVLVVERPIAKGATLDEVEARVELRELAANSVAEGSVSNLDDLTGLITAVDLVEGEQLLLGRFETPAEAATETRIEVPSDLLQVTVAVRPERAVGGRLVPGDLVAIVASFDPFELNAVEPGDEEALQEALDATVLTPEPDPETGEVASTPVSLKTPNATKIIMHKILVTAIQVEELPQEDATVTGGPVELAPTGNLLITLAARAEEVEKIIFTIEHGSLWMALESPDAPEPETEIRTRGNIYE